MQEKDSDLNPEIFQDEDLQELVKASYAIDIQESLYSFIKLMWPIIEPGTAFKDAMHIEAICEHLEAVTRGEIRNLLINIPPGHAKSLIISVFWPAWEWIKYPERRWIFASYAAQLAIRDSVRCRDLIASHKYKTVFEPQWSLSDDQNQKIRFNNTKKGYRIATSVGGSGTGERADRIVCDDPHNAIDVKSELMRQSAIDWWFNTMSTRDSDPKKSSRVVVMQRLHSKDLAGEIVSRGGYEHLCLPTEYMPSKAKATKIGWKDPRTKEGELLWPEHFGPNEVAAAKKNLGSRGYGEQHQQDPVPQDGGLFKRRWWKTYRELPLEDGIIVQFWDTAQKAGITNDFSVCSTWKKLTGGYYLLDLWREKVESPQLESAIKMQFAKWSPSAVVIEDKSSGISIIQRLQQTTTLPIIPYDPKQRDKETRASAATPTVEAGNCYLPDGASWCEDFVSEHEQFPLGEHDDQVDTTSMMVEYFIGSSIIEPRIRTL